MIAHIARNGALCAWLVLTLSTAHPAPLNTGNDAPPTSATALKALTGRLESLHNVEVAYREHTRASALSAGPTSSSLEVFGKADALTSSGWVLWVAREPQKTAATLTECSGTTCRIHELDATAQGSWHELRRPITLPGGENPALTLCSFFDRRFFPAFVVPDSMTTLTVCVDGHWEPVEVLSLRDANSSVTIGRNEPAILSYSGKSPHMRVEEQVEGFTRVVPLGLVPKRRVIRTEEPAGAKKTAVFVLETLKVNQPGFALTAAKDSPQAVLGRYRP